MNKLILLAATFSLLIPGNLSGQITFQKSYTISPNEKHEIYQTNDGGYAIVGRKIIRLNYLGDTIWTKSYILGSSAVTGGVQTLDGGYAISGHTNSAGIGLRDLFLIKTDSLGNILWSKAYGGLNHDNAYSLYQTTDSGFIISGQTRSVMPGDLSIYLVRTDLNGNLLWTKAIDGGGSGKGTTVIQTNDGGFIVSGSITYKMDNTGNIQWSRAYDGPGSGSVNCIRQTSDGGYILIGTAYNFDSANIVVIFLYKIDSAGSLQWSQHFGNYFTFGHAVEQTNDGGYIIAGQQGPPSTTSDVCLIKTNSLGDTLWTRAFGSADSDVAGSVKQTADGGYIVTASSYGFGYGIYVIKTDNLGNSGCNELPTAFMVIDSSVTELTFTDSVSSGGTAVPFTATSTNGTTVLPLCFTNNTGIHETKPNNSFHIYPNPSSGNFTITTESKITKGTIQVFNIHGTSVFEESIINASTNEIHLKNSTPGIYFVKVFDGEKQYTFGKLIIIRE